MGSVLVFCEADDKGVRSASLPALTRRAPRWPSTAAAIWSRW